MGEFVGTFLVVFFGCGSVCSAVLTGAQVGVFQVAIVWGLGIATAIYLTAGLSGAHLNPAVTVAFSVWQRFPRRRVLAYILAQMLGAFVAAAVLYGIFQDALTSYELTHHIPRGGPGSEATAMIFGEFFPSPAGQPLTEVSRLRMSHLRAFFAEAVGTAVLLFVICGVTDARNASRVGPHAAIIIGLTVTLLISLLGPLTMAGLNPARDLAPRLFSALAGWGSYPFSVNGLGWFTVYVLAPVLGAVFGSGMYHLVFRPSEDEA